MAVARTLTRGKRGRESAMHAADIWLDTGKLPECSDRLVHAHTPTVEHAGTPRGSRLQELRFYRRINDIRGPKRGFERGYRHRIAGEAAHANLCRINDPLGARYLALEIARDAAARRAVVHRKIGG